METETCNKKELHEELNNIVADHVNKIFWKLMGWAGIPIALSLISIGALYLKVDINTDKLNDPTERFTQTEGDALKEHSNLRDDALQRNIDQNQEVVIKRLDEIINDVKYIRNNQR